MENQDKRTAVIYKNIFETLTQREIEVLKKIAQGKTNKKIARELFIEKNTVKTHRQNIRKKLKLRGRNALIRWAIENKNRLTLN